MVEHSKILMKIQVTITPQRGIGFCNVDLTKKNITEINLENNTQFRRRRLAVYGFQKSTQTKSKSKLANDPSGVSIFFGTKVTD